MRQVVDKNPPAHVGRVGCVSACGDGGRTLGPQTSFAFQIDGPYTLIIGRHQARVGCGHSRFWRRRSAGTFSIEVRDAKSFISSHKIASDRQL